VTQLLYNMKKGITWPSHTDDGEDVLINAGAN